MDCNTFQRRLAERLDERAGEPPTADERSAVERHLAACPRCRELDALVCGDLEVFPIEPPADLTAAVLERTTGAACERARDLLCAYVDASLSGFDSELVRQHVTGCAGCRQTVLALEHLAEDLPGMAQLAPDANFTHDVLSATLPRRERWNRRLAALADSWNRLLERPRLGLEAGYVGAVCLWALFGLSASPLSDVPRMALGALQTAPTVGAEKTAQAMTGLQVQIGEVSRRTWETSTQRGADAVDQLTTVVHSRIERTAEARGALRRHGGELGDAALQLNLKQSARAARDIGAGLGELWREITSAGGNDDAVPSPTAPPDEC